MTIFNHIDYKIEQFLSRRINIMWVNVGKNCEKVEKWQIHRVERA